MVGVPVNWPLELASWMPGGRVPEVTAQVNGGAALATRKPKLYGEPAVAAGVAVVTMVIPLACTVSW